MSDQPRIARCDETKIDALFAPLDQNHLPGAAVGVAIDGLPAYRKGFGLANMEQPVTLSPTVRMRIASITKHFLSLAYMLLCEDGKAALDDPIGKYLPESHPVTHAITLRQLMGHVSGLRDAHDITYHFSGTSQPVTSAELLSLYRDIDDVNAEPGTTWSYNNGAYLMVSVAVERITGRSLEEVLRERVFEPAGMYATLLRRRDTDFVPNSAALHMLNSVGVFEKPSLGTALAGEGGVVSTIDDMLRWLAHMDAPSVGSEQTWRVMRAPQALSNGTSTGYGLGLISQRYRGLETLHHPGGLLGCNSHMLKLPAAGLDVVVLSNRHDLSSTSLLYKIVDICLPDLPPRCKPAGRPPASGTFRSRTTGRVVELSGKDGQQVASIEGTEVPLEPDTEGVLRPAGVAGYIKQSVTLLGDAQRPQSVRYSEFGTPDELIRVDPMHHCDLRAIEGRYRSSSTHTLATIREAEQGPELITAGRFGSMAYRLEPVAEHVWRAKGKDLEFLGGLLAFEADGQLFRFSNGRTRSLVFRRS